MTLLIDIVLTAFLPSSFAMNLTMLAYSYYLEPSTTNTRGDRRVTMATTSFAIGAILGWPFAALLALPFVVEELFVKSGDEVVGEEIVFNWRVERVARLIKAVVCAAALAVSMGLPSTERFLRLLADSRYRLRFMGIRQTDVPDAQHRPLQPLLG
jgi:hypothetical protein